MDVTLRPPMHGCLIALISVWTLGLYPLLRRMGERHFVRRMDDTGVVTRGGRQIRWEDLTSVRHAVTQVKGFKTSEEYLLEAPKGKASLPVWRTANPGELRDYMLKRLPPGIRIIPATRISYR